jgi:hypothetical protein
MRKYFQHPLLYIPIDKELLLHYLRRKSLACLLPADIIPVIDLARPHPWDRPHPTR